MKPSRQEEPNYERTDVKAGPVALLAAALVALTVCSVVAAGVIFGVFQDRSKEGSRPASPFGDRIVEEANPGPPAEPGDDLAKLRAYEERVLGSYGWVEKSRGIVRLPDKRAMKLMLERRTGQGGESRAEDGR